ncbi:hypothetical protein VNI00_004481 [Paramarasmius palmivorus]|uniref:Uncharacterized protein n=1 Tax=Paramarasmius palmivorus TaxID=297713 RepID=A0AAW0DIX5_9AGAR
MSGSSTPAGSSTHPPLNHISIILERLKAQRSGKIPDTIKELCVRAVRIQEKAATSVRTRELGERVCEVVFLVVSVISIVFPSRQQTSKDHNNDEPNGTNEDRTQVIKIDIRITHNEAHSLLQLLSEIEEFADNLQGRWWLTRYLLYLHDSSAIANYSNRALYEAIYPFNRPLLPDDIRKCAEAVAKLGGESSGIDHLNTLRRASNPLSINLFINETIQQLQKVMSSTKTPSSVIES